MALFKRTPDPYLEPQGGGDDTEGRKKLHVAVSLPKASGLRKISVKAKASFKFPSKDGKR